ncbi:hypothetical protein KJ359_004388 [Pestalotiopsis sp. 9143b]|nr:hypothetical protein KJ359_004388 [Pestalotiopsis sp. 9143b]
MDMVWLLLGRSKNVQLELTRKDDMGATPLLAASGFGGHSGSEAVMQLLLDTGADPLQDVYTAGRWRDGSDEQAEESRRRQGIELPFLVANALTTAMKFASPHLIDRLFHAGVDLCDGGSYRIEGWPQDKIIVHVTPLHLACGESSIERVQALLRLANPNASRLVAQRDSMGRTPFHWSVLGDQSSPLMGEGSSQTGDDILLQRTQCIQALRACDREAVGINVQDRDGKTALHLAAESYLRELATCLLKQGADPNLKDLAGRTPLMTLVSSDTFTMIQKPIIGALSKGVVDLAAVDGNGNSALHLACSHYTKLWIARLFIERGALCHITNGTGELPLHKAVTCLWPPRESLVEFDMYRNVVRSQDQIISLLLEKSSGVYDMNSKDSSGRSAAELLAETRLRVSKYIAQEAKGKAHSKLDKINHAQIRAGFQIMPPEMQELIEAESGVWGLRTMSKEMPLSRDWHRARGRSGIRGGLGGPAAQPALLIIPRHRRRISSETYGF